MSSDAILVSSVLVLQTAMILWVQSRHHAKYLKQMRNDSFDDGRGWERLTRELTELGKKVSAASVEALTGQEPKGSASPSKKSD